MKRSIATILLVLPFFLVACVSPRSEVATKFGYEKSSKVQTGPYQLHHGKSGTEELMLLAEGNWNIVSRETGRGTTVYLDGLPFIQFERTHDGSVTNLSLALSDAFGRLKTTLIDRDADGEWDLKSDHDSGRKFIWKDHRWRAR